MVWHLNAIQITTIDHLKMDLYVLQTSKVIPLHYFNIIPRLLGSCFCLSFDIVVFVHNPSDTKYYHSFKHFLILEGKTHFGLSLSIGKQGISAY